MNEREAREVLLVRAHEEPAEPAAREGDAGTAAAPAAAQSAAVLWSEADRRWASDEAARAEGEGASADRLLARRARLAIGRLASRAPAAARALSLTDAPRNAGLALVASAVAAGFATDALGPSSRVNLLAPPLLALLAWNLVVYAALAWHALRRLARGQRAGAAASDGPSRGAGWLGRAALGLQALRLRLGRRTDFASAPGAAAGRFVVDWARVGAPLHGLRAAAALHVAAAAFAAALLGSLYLRGLAFEYRAGWDSTFLGPAQVERLLAAVLGPAARLGGIALPGADELAGLRFSAGPGEPAARWIHLYAVTLGAVVLVPRTLLAAVAGWRAHRLALRFPLPLEAPYFRRLVGTAAGAFGRRLWVAVLPYSHRPAPTSLPGLTAALGSALDSAVELDLRPTVALGGEDGFAADEPPTACDAVALLFPLAATPERENHLAFVALVQRRAAGRPCLVVVDEAAMRRRFGIGEGTGDSGDGARRLDERRAAWRRALSGVDARPLFADLSAAPAIAASAAGRVTGTAR